MRAFLMGMMAAVVVALTSLGAGVTSVFACAGLIGSNGAVNLNRTTTLAAYHDGVEHYVTAFQFAGGGGQFGTLIPLPAAPTKVERGGGWTLQRLVRETAPPQLVFAASADASSRGKAEVLQEVRIDALDITILKGGGPDVAEWAQEHGFKLSPDAPEVLDFYAQRSPIFLAAVFDGNAAKERGQQVGDGTPVHLTIPTSNPWVPLRILALGKQPKDTVQAGVFLLTDDKPSLLPGRTSALKRTHSAAATNSLLNDLRSDVGMGWVPKTAWLTEMQINGAAEDLKFDLAVDVSGKDSPSRVAAGLEAPTKFRPFETSFETGLSAQANGDAGSGSTRAAVTLIALLVAASTLAAFLTRRWQAARR
jgi:hypothetical protein